MCAKRSPSPQWSANQVGGGLTVLKNKNPRQVGRDERGFFFSTSVRPPATQTICIGGLCSDLPDDPPFRRRAILLIFVWPLRRVSPRGPPFFQLCLSPFACPTSDIRQCDFWRIPRGGTSMHSLIVVTILCLTSTPAFACVFHTDCNPAPRARLVSAATNGVRVTTTRLQVTPKTTPQRAWWR